MKLRHVARKPRFVIIRGDFDVLILGPKEVVYVLTLGTSVSRKVAWMRLTFEGIDIEVDRHFGFIDPTPHWFIGPHAHTCFEIHVCQSGHGINQFEDGHSLELCPDTVYLAPPGEVHAQWGDESRPLGIYYLLFQIHKPRDILDIHSVYREMPLSSLKATTIHRMGQVGTLRERLRAELKAIELIWDVLEPELQHRGLLREPAASGAVARGSQACAHVVESALQYIKAHALENPGVEDIAAHCHLSPRHLARVFQNSIGGSIHQAIEQERLRWAMERLAEPGVAVREICEEMNFSYVQYFSQWFRKYAHMSPTEYRNRILKNG